MGTRYFRKVIFRMKLFSSMQSFIVIQLIRGCENIFSLVSLSKSKTFTRVALVSFVQHSCYTRVVPVLLFCTRVILVSLVSRSCRLCVHLCRSCLADQIIRYSCITRNVSIIIQLSYYESLQKHITVLYVTNQRKKVICYNISYYVGFLSKCFTKTNCNREYVRPRLPHLVITLKLFATNDICENNNLVKKLVILLNLRFLVKSVLLKIPHQFEI